MGVVKTGMVGGKREKKRRALKYRLESQVGVWLTSLRADMDCGRGTVLV